MLFVCLCKWSDCVTLYAVLVPACGSCLSICYIEDMYPVVVARPRYRFYSEGLEYVQYPLDSTCFTTPC